jgi:hypothetical protein
MLSYTCGTSQGRFMMITAVLTVMLYNQAVVNKAYASIVEPLPRPRGRQDFPGNGRQSSLCHVWALVRVPVAAFAVFRYTGGRVGIRVQLTVYVIEWWEAVCFPTLCWGVITLMYLVNSGWQQREDRSRHYRCEQDLRQSSLKLNAEPRPVIQNNIHCDCLIYIRSLTSVDLGTNTFYSFTYVHL